MTALLEKLIAIIAPVDCIICSKEDNVVCLTCLAQLFPGVNSVCVFCTKNTEDSAICRNCQRSTGLERVWVAAEYSGMVAELIRRYKFERLRAAYMPLAAGIDGTMSYASPSTLIVPVPTAPSRVRQRGYDQATLLARELARLRSLPYATPLLRVTGVRQVGLGRTARKTQAQIMFTVRGDLRGRHVLIVDDVCTTGATLQAASAALKKAGAASVQAAVAAWTTPKMPT